MSDRPRWTDHPLVQLTRVRYREFFREPEAVFWVFIFPVLLAAGLGIAFRNRAPDLISVGVVTGDMAPSPLVEALRRTAGVEIVTSDEEVASEALRTGEVTMVLVPFPDGSVEYRYDDTRPESRIARLVV